ncbi:hypothetical protein [Streptomyces sp. NBC_01006]|nr:hypothetical protein OG509_15965 [Streptomyces sp. NBC_01006]
MTEDAFVFASGGGGGTLYAIGPDGGVHRQRAADPVPRCAA